jgi:hypothetical protein
MSNLIHHPPLITARVTNFIRTDNIVIALLRLRQELEEIAPMESQHIPADQLLYDVCVALDLPVLSINQILGKSQNPYQEHLRGD